VKNNYLAAVKQTGNASAISLYNTGIIRVCQEYMNTDTFI